MGARALVLVSRGCRRPVCAGLAQEETVGADISRPSGHETTNQSYETVTVIDDSDVNSLAVVLSLRLELAFGVNNCFLDPSEFLTYAGYKERTSKKKISGQGFASPGWHIKKSQAGPGPGCT